MLVLENVLTDEECCAFVESMRGEDGSFPERLGQANLDVPLGCWTLPEVKCQISQAAFQ